jgi:hypothetical protein
MKGRRWKSMADLNKIRDKLKQQRSMGVNREGGIVENNPNNKGEKTNAEPVTTLEPNRFYIS